MKAILWFWRYHAVDFDVFDSEEDAATSAVSREDYGEASIIGVQLEDGTLLERDAWPAFEAADNRAWAESAKRMDEQAAAPQPQTIKISSPFDGSQVVAYAEDVPDWMRNLQK